MDIFKLKQGIAYVYPITRQCYEAATGQDARYRRAGPSGEAYFAVCPACDNPIQLIGLYKDSVEGGKRPYGKHRRQSIPALADYDEQAYLDCPYSNPRWAPPTGARKRDSRMARQIIRLLHDQFDRVIYILSKDTEIGISAVLARKMLQGYISREGWLFRGAAEYNLPWAFAEGQVAYPLYGQRIRKGGALHSAIADKCPEACFEDIPNSHFARLVARRGQFVNLKFAFLAHDHTVINEHLRETIDLWVYRGEPSTASTIYRTTIEVKTDYFLNLITLPDDDTFRNQKLLDIAHALLNPLI